jgi:hypothetical protein
VIDELTGHVSKGGTRPALLLGAATKAVISGESAADVTTPRAAGKDRRSLLSARRGTAASATQPADFRTGIKAL